VKKNFLSTVNMPAMTISLKMTQAVVLAKKPSKVIEFD